MRLLFRLLGHLRPYAAQMVIATLLLAVAGGLMSVVVATMKPLVNDVFLARPETPAAGEVEPGGSDVLERVQAMLPTAAWTAWLRQRAFVAVPLLVIVVFLARGICLYFGRYLITKSGASMIRGLRLKLYESIVHQSLDFFRAHSTGLIHSRVLADVQRLQRISTEVLADMLRVALMVPFLLLIILIHDWRISLFAMVVIPLAVYPMLRLGQRLRGASRRSQETMAEASSLLQETVTGIKVVQGFAMEEHEIRRFRAALDRMLRADLKAGRAEALTTPVLELVAALAGAALFYVAGRGIGAGQLDPGDVAVVLSGLGLLFISLRRLNRVNVEMQQALAAADRVFQMIDWPRAIVERPGAVELTAFDRRLRFERVDFAYGGEKVLSDVDLTIHKGEVIALVGPSGSGKTTLVSLLPRFYDPTAGRITIDGVDVRDATLRSLRALFGLVTQETVIFDDTVYGNIAYGRDDVPRERVEAAARAAHAHEFIAAMEEGYDTRLGERGARLSMGQRQRIAIARALVKDPPILILDEATSALDSESERLIEEALETLLEGRTSIVIAHRLVTVRRADRILVLDRGRIVEEGDHRQLLARGGLYRRLYELQFRDEDVG
ncbi:MAG: ATP-binding cassette domain-containing protein [Acidobacteria bacterium]|nr:MAG: ATP-binding cassette domain-containing protein [Acidobacteriota bacterium]